MALAGCVQAGGPDAEKWLGSQANVTSVKLSYETDGLEQRPDLTAIVSPAASDDALENLASRVSDYLRAHTTRRLTIALTASGISLLVAKSQPVTTVTEWAALRHDKRVVSGMVSDTLNLLAARADVVPVYRDHVAGLPLSVDQSGSISGIEIGGVKACTPTPAYLAFAAQMAADTAVHATQLAPCGSSVIAVTGIAAMFPLVQMLHAQGESDVTVVYDSDDNLIFQRAAYSVPVARGTPGALTLLAAVTTIGELNGFVIANDGSLNVTGPLEPAAEAVFSNSAVSSVSSVTVTSGLTTIRANSVVDFDADDALANAVHRISSHAYVTVAPSAIAVVLVTDAGKKIDDYSKHGKAVIRAVVTSSLWHDRTVTIKNFDQGGVQFVNGVGSAAGLRTASGPSFIAYWNFLTT